MEDVGQEPVVAKKETQGFIICRVQHAITAECFKLIRVKCLFFLLKSILLHFYLYMYTCNSYTVAC